MFFEQSYKQEMVWTYYLSIVKIILILKAAQIKRGNLHSMRTWY
ncbi:MAG: hypothetical protein JWM28_3387 [Chitinophagaceae bacterium]|nr:hypothetical protein [Chitinophagaceae bacterium]